MAIKRINPSRNSWDNGKRASYGYVIKVPKLPDAHEYVKDFVVYNQEDSCFYKCVEVSSSSQHYYTWRAVTYGADRPFLVPVGKLTTTDALASQASEGFTDKHTVEAIAKTLNELVFGMRRYRDMTHAPLGYTQVEVDGVKKYVNGVEYYEWERHDTLDTIGLETIDIVDEETGTTVRRDWKISPTKGYTGDFKKLEAGTDYTVGTVISGEIYTKSPSKTSAVIWDNVTMQDIADKANEFVNRFNSHGADIPVLEAGEYENAETLSRYCAVTNLLIDEVNPFSIPWQLMLNRQNFLELEVGAVTLQTGLTEEQKMTRTDLAKWKLHAWNFPEGYQPPELLYGTVVQAVDSTLKLIKFRDVTTGNYGDLHDWNSSEFGTTLVSWLNALYMRVANLIDITNAYGIAFDQVWKALGFGEVGYIVYGNSIADGNRTMDSDIFYTWNDTLKIFEVVTDGGDMKVSAWRSAHPGVALYTFINERRAIAMISENAANIAINKENIRANKQAIDELVGLNLYAIYIEKSGEIVEGEQLYYYDKDSEETDHPFIPIDAEDMEGTIPELQEKFSSPIFVRCLRKDYIPTTDKVIKSGETYYWFDELVPGYFEIDDVAEYEDLDEVKDAYGIETIYVLRQTAAVQVRVNNEELARLSNDFYNFRVRATEGIRKLKILTGVQGDIDQPREWDVDGYVELKDGEGVYHEYRRYYRLDPETEDAETQKFIELISGTVEDYEAGYKFVLTQDEWFRAEVEYYTREWNEAESVYEYTEYVPTVGAPVDPDTFFVKVGVDYVVPYYERTKDTVFQSGKKYYVTDSKGNYIEAGVTPGATVDTRARFYYEYINPTPRPTSGVYIRKARKEHGGYEENNTHRGLIDRNTKDIEQQRQDSGDFQKWTRNQLEALEDFILSLMMSTLDIITQERSTLSLLHEVVGKFIAIHNALEKLQDGGQTYKSADGIYDSGYDYYMNGEKVNPDPTAPTVWEGCGFFSTDDTTLVPGKLYYTRSGKGTVSSPYRYTEYPFDGYVPVYKTFTYDNTELEPHVFVKDGTDYVECTTGEELYDTLVGIGLPDPELDGDDEFVLEPGDEYDGYVFVLSESEVPEETYFEWHEWFKMRRNQDYEVGLEVAPNVYTKDLVIATTENYTINDIRMAVNRCLSYHISTKEIEEYTELPETEIILESMTYFRYIDGYWEEIHPEIDDPSMIGKRVKDYDPDHKWYIHTGNVIPDGKQDPRYTETPVRMFLNELIKLHRRTGQDNSAAALRNRAESLIDGLFRSPNSSTFPVI